MDINSNQQLSQDELERYSRHILIPEWRGAQQKLKTAKVLCIGAGGLGSPVLLYLAAAGLGYLGIVDDDVVEQSNLQRQIIHNMASLKKSKVSSAAIAIAALNPNVKVTTYPYRLNIHNVLPLFKQYDIVVDCTDNFASRYLISDACSITGRPHIWGAVSRLEGQVSTFCSHPPADKQPITYRDLYPIPPPIDFSQPSAQAGILGVVCASIGAIMATETLKIITGLGDLLLGRLISYNALTMRYREFIIPAQSDP